MTDSIIEVAAGPFTIRIKAGDRIEAHSTGGKRFEPQSLAAWAMLCGRGQIVVDVGAYTGIYSIVAALRGSTVIAFEPLPENAERLLENAILNGVRDRVNLVEAALSDAIGSAMLRYNPHVPFTSAANLDGVGGRAAVNVPLTTLDLFDLSSVSAIKVDVERHEPAVLRGAAKTLERCRPTLLVEVLGDAEKVAVRGAVAGYEVRDVLDKNNWLMTPC